jgi:hypothetical protein
MNHRKIRLPEFLDIRHVNLARLSAPTHLPLLPPTLTPRRYPRYSFLLETLPTPGHRAVGWIRPMKKFKWPHWESKPPPSGLKQLLHCITLHILIMRTNFYGFKRKFIILNPWGTKSFAFRVALCLARFLFCIIGFGGLQVACWPLVSKFAGSNTAEAVGFLRAKIFSARLPSEGN